MVRARHAAGALWRFPRGETEPGETVLVSGATGNFGSAAVAVALAMGAACVVAPGRNETVLQELNAVSATACEP